MNYASVVFAPMACTRINTLQVIQYRCCRIALKAPWCVRNVDLHYDLELDSMRKCLNITSQRFFEKAVPHDHALNVAAGNYKRDKHDLDD